MTRDEIVKLANLCDLNRVCGPLDTLLDHEWEDLHRFAELAVAAEREANAKLCEELFAPAGSDNQSVYEAATLDCAQAIRSRGIGGKESGDV